MSTSRSISITAGSLFIVATVSALVAAAFLPPLAGHDYLTDVDANSNQTAVASLFYLTAAGASVGIAISFYPLLKKVDAALAIGSVVFRTIEAVFYTAEVACLLAISTLSQQFVAAQPSDRSPLQLLADTLVNLREHFALVAVFAFIVGSVMYYVVFFRSRLVPRWLSVWGLVAAPLMLAACVMALFNDAPVTGYAALFVPIAVQEIVFAVWLLVMGFRPTPLTDMA